MSSSLFYTLYSVPTIDGHTIEWNQISYLNNITVLEHKDMKILFIIPKILY